MLSFNELRKLLAEYAKYKGCEIIPKASVVNAGFPGKFNYSFWEPELDELVGKNYLIPNKDLIHWKIQPCVRHYDFFNKIEHNEGGAYLSLFEMGAISGAIQKLNVSKEEKATIVGFTVKSIADFLINTLSLDKEKLFVSIFMGGEVKDATKGKYDFKKIIGKDNLTYEAWIKAGLNKKNIILDRSRNTLLALKLDRPCWWGFRNEILYKKDEELIDIGTVEWLDMEPVFKDGDIIGIKEWPHLIAFNLIGLERILFVKNNFKHIRECDHILPIYLTVANQAKIKNENDIFNITECIRTCHRIFTDSGGYKNLSKKRKEIVRKFLRELKRNTEKIRINLSIKKLEGLLNLNAELQGFYPELLLSVGSVANEIHEHLK